MIDRLGPLFTVQEAENQLESQKYKTIGMIEVTHLWSLNQFVIFSEVP